ncbi:unnamed protein product, partial [Didymodactylos carnosus]
DVIIRPRHKQIHVHSRRQQTVIPFDDDLPIDGKLVQQYTILPREKAIVEIKIPIIAAKHLYFEAINIIGYNRWDYVLIYLDDIIIFSDTFEQHLQHLNQILSILNQHQFQLNYKKCLIAVQQLEFLSHVITSDTIEPSKERIQAILDMPEPKTLAQANRFIGKIGWYRKFIKKICTNCGANPQSYQQNQGQKENVLLA